MDLGPKPSYIYQSLMHLASPVQSHPMKVTKGSHKIMMNVIEAILENDLDCSIRLCSKTKIVREKKEVAILACFEVQRGSVHVNRKHPDAPPVLLWNIYRTPWLVVGIRREQASMVVRREFC